MQWDNNNKDRLAILRLANQETQTPTETKPIIPKASVTPTQPKKQTLTEATALKIILENQSDMLNEAIDYLYEQTSKSMSKTEFIAILNTLKGMRQVLSADINHILKTLKCL